MSQELLTWIDSFYEQMMLRPPCYGSLDAIEMQCITLMHCRLLITDPVKARAFPRFVNDTHIELNRRVDRLRYGVVGASEFCANEADFVTVMREFKAACCTSSPLAFKPMWKYEEEGPFWDAVRKQIADNEGWHKLSPECKAVKVVEELEYCESCHHRKGD